MSLMSLSAISSHPVSAGVCLDSLAPLAWRTCCIRLTNLHLVAYALGYVPLPRQVPLSETSCSVFSRSILVTNHRQSDKKQAVHVSGVVISRWAAYRELEASAIMTTDKLVETMFTAQNIDLLQTLPSE
jgi:hypothetical protein